MKVRVLLFVAILAVAVSMPNLMAQGKAQGGQKVSPQEAPNLQGTIQSINKNASTFTVKIQTASRVVSHNAKTSFRYGHANDNKPGSFSKVKEGYYISCTGSFDSKGVMMATDCVYRESR